MVPCSTIVVKLDTTSFCLTIPPKCGTLCAVHPMVLGILTLLLAKVLMTIQVIAIYREINFSKIEAAFKFVEGHDALYAHSVKHLHSDIDKC